MESRAGTRGGSYGIAYALSGRQKARGFPDGAARRPRVLRLDSTGSSGVGGDAVGIVAHQHLRNRYVLPDAPAGAIREISFESLPHAELRARRFSGASSTFLSAPGTGLPRAWCADNEGRQI